jgi:quercetin dioxygenase-like cupin family protein
MTTDTNDAMPNKIVHVPARTTQGYWFAECLFNFLVSGEESGGSYTTMELLIPPEKGAGLHIHDNEEEQFYVLEGELTYWVGDQTIHMSAGSFVHIPRGTTHGFTNGDTPAKLLATFSPAGIEKFFQEMGELMDDQTDDPWLRG